MNIRSIVKKILEEEIERKYQAHFDNLYMTNWNPEYKRMFNTDQDLPLSIAENLYKTYRNIMIGKNIKMENEIVYQFLNKNDGRFGTRKLEISDLQNFERLTFKEFYDLLKDFNKNIKINPNLVDDDADMQSAIHKQKLKEIYDENGVFVTSKKIAESKKLWYDTSRPIVNEGPVRVYSITTLDESIRMGYYYQYIHSKNITKNIDPINFREHLIKYNHYTGMRSGDRVYKRSKPWCTTMRGNTVHIPMVLENGEIDNSENSYDNIHYPNQYRNYRTNSKLTFYYIIDDSREESDPYYMSSLEVSSYNLITITSQYNDNEVPKTWDEIVEIYPQLKNYKDSFVYRAFTEAEMGDMAVNELDLINEDENNQYFFGRQSINVQQAYVESGKILTKVISWQMTNPNVRKKYLKNIEREDYTRKIDNFELLQEILSRDVDKNILDVQMKDNGFTEGYKIVVSALFKIHFDLRRTNLLNKDISLYKNRRTNLFGLFDLEKAEWYSKDGITYKDTYKLAQKNIKIYLVPTSKKTYINECYTISDSIDDKTLYCMFPFDKKNNPKYGAYYFTHKGFNEMLNNTENASNVSNVSNISGMGKMLSKDIDVDKDIDIKEAY